MSDIKIRRANALKPKHARAAADKTSARLSEAMKAKARKIAPKKKKWFP